MQTQRANARGLSPVELAVAIAIFGCALAATVPACVRAVRMSRQAEAVESTERILSAAIQTRNATPSTPLLSVPLTPASVPRGKAASDPDGTWAHATWQALGFSIDEPHWYSYRVDIDPDAQTAIRVVAQGDLNGNGILSSYERSAMRDGATIVARPELVITSDLE